MSLLTHCCWSLEEASHRWMQVFVLFCFLIRAAFPPLDSCVCGRAECFCPLDISNSSATARRLICASLQMHPFQLSKQWRTHTTRPCTSPTVVVHHKAKKEKKVEQLDIQLT